MADLWEYQTKTRKFSKLRIGGLSDEEHRVHAPLLTAEDEAEILGSYQITGGDENKIVLIGASEERTRSQSASTAEPELIEYFSALDSNGTRTRSKKHKKKTNTTSIDRTDSTNSIDSTDSTVSEHIAVKKHTTPINVTRYLEQSSDNVVVDNDTIDDYDGGIELLDDSALDWTMETDD